MGLQQVAKRNKLIKIICRFLESTWNLCTKFWRVSHICM